VNALYSPLISKGIIVIVGGYGSGKSEVAVNLARHLAKSQPEPVAIADLDIVNPYFRSREAMKVLDAMNVKSIVPPGAQFYADLPIILPQIKGAIEKNEGKLLLDAGGDDVGARVLSSLSDAFVEGTYDMFLVLNANRPFTSTMDGCVKMINSIEQAARLKFTGLISNTHMMDDSTVDGALHGVAAHSKSWGKNQTAGCLSECGSGGG
jgi:MinD-like ATPase involved in chromosome partitioning or flagellar assembly